MNQTENMRISARLLIFFALLLTFCFTKTPVFAQTVLSTPTPIVAQSVNISSTNPNGFNTSNVDPNVPRNHDAYTQVVLIDVMSAIMCQLTGIDPANPKQPCLAVNTATGKIGIPPKSNTTNSFGQVPNTQPQVGGALGMVAGFIGSVYVPAVSSSQYINYLADNFGIVKKTYAAAPGAAANTNCSNYAFGYGFCGLIPIFTLWTDTRDFSYALLTILFIAIGIGVMLRFRVDPRTVMTLQNQIPRVIIAILLITFSYAIAGIMIDMMWTITYAGINYISAAAPQSQVCDYGKKTPIAQGTEQTLINEPLSFVNSVFDGNCNGGLLNVSSKVSSAVENLVITLIQDLFGIHIGGCSIFNVGGCLTNFFLWLADQIVKLIIIVIILVSLFRLWFMLIQTYITFLIFVIMGPIWIVLGLIPGRPLGFEKWLRIMFANLAAFPLVAFVLVFGRVLMDALPQNPNPQSIFIPPLMGNPNAQSFVDFMGLGAIMLAPTIPQMIKDRMKATGSAKYGAAIAAGVTGATAIATAPGRRTWEGLNRVNATTGAAEGSLAVMRQRVAMKMPWGRRAVARRRAMADYYANGDNGQSFRQRRNAARNDLFGQRRGVVSRVRNWRRGGQNPGTGTPPPAPPPTPTT